MEVNQLPQVGNVLGCFVGHARNVILENEESGRPVAIGSNFLHVDYSTVGDAPHLIEPLAALAFQILRPFRFAAQ